jgi:Xaa-Pro aminopeptidase
MTMEQRIKWLRQQMVESGLQAFLISHPINRRYITGFTGSTGLALITEKEAILITDFRYATQAKEESPQMTFVEYTSSIWQTLAEQCQRVGMTSLAFEADHLTFAQHQQLQKRLDKMVLKPTSGLVEQLRTTKAESELAMIRKAARIADDALAQMMQKIKPGMKEKEVSLRLEVLMRQMGASASAFTIIVASGKRSALPHGVASDKMLEKGDLVTIDFGAIYQGYHSDITRTVVLGKPNERQKELYEIVLAAQRRAILSLRPGITGREVDLVARDYITQQGYGAYFGHGTGHGLGLEVHEAPVLSSLSARGDHVLASGMVVTVEPGIYLPHFGGVRIEDDVLITENGYEVLTHSAKDFIWID